MRRVNLSPTHSQDRSDADTYTDSMEEDEVEATLSNVDDEFHDTEQALSEWSRSPSSRSYTSFTGSQTGSYTGSYTGTQSGTGYTGSMSYVTLPTVTPRTNLTSPAPDPRARLSRITERTEPSSRPTSGAYSASGGANRAETPDALRRSMLLGASSIHSRSTTEPGPTRDLPPRGRANELIAQFEASSSSGSDTVRRSNTPGPGTSSSPFYNPSQSATNPLSTTGYTISSTGYGYGSGSRSTSPTKSSRNTSSLTYTAATESRPTASTMLSPRTGTPTGTFRSESPTYTRTGSYLSPSTYTQTPSTYSQTLSRTGTDTRSYTTGTYTATQTRTSVTPSASFQRPLQRSPRNALTSVSNIVAQWKERTPRDNNREEKASVATSVMSASPPPTRRQRDEDRTPTKTQPQDSDRASLRSFKNSALPPGFDADELQAYTQSSEPVSLVFPPFPIPESDR
jgi:hypothetical protein